MMHATRTRHLTTKVRAIAASGLLSAVALMGCTTPPPEPSDNVTCESFSGQMSVSPGVVETDRPNTYALTAPSSTASCLDATGTGITSARIDKFSLLFPSIGCFVTAGTQGTGSATIRWSDGTRSRLNLVGTLDSAYGGDIASTVVSGHFTGMTGSVTFLAAPTKGECFNGGITAESIETGTLTLRP